VRFPTHLVGLAIGAAMTIRVLLADDQVMFREALAMVLAHESGIVVVGEAGDGRDAVDATRRLLPDVVVMDISMPILNGIDATAEISAQWSRVYVLMCSVHTDEAMVERALSAGAIGYVPKSCHAAELVHGIRTVAAGRGHLHDELADRLIHGFRRNAGGDDSGALTPRERSVLQLIAEGYSSVEIGTRLGISSKTVGTHRERLMAKIGTQSVAGLTKYAIRHRLTDLTTCRSAVDRARSGV
jgi:DNA-binding NarL/FixJ family response regulator